MAKLDFFKKIWILKMLLMKNYEKRHFFENSSGYCFTKINRKKNISKTWENLSRNESNSRIINFCSITPPMAYSLHASLK